MPTYKAPVKDTIFLLKDVLKYQKFNHLPGFSDLTPEILEQVLNEAAKLCEEVIAPTNQEGDNEGCFHQKSFTMTKTGEPPNFETEHHPAVVKVPKCFHEPWKKFKDGGWLGLSVPEEYGGQGLPYALASSVNEFVSSANMAFSLFPGLTRGAIQALLKVATEEQKKMFIPRMASGEWTGTMNLTEPHCGTDLGLIKTKAVPTDISDPELGQHYRITGQKIFISCGEHDLSSSIVHLVLARIEGDPEGVKGISLFIVPKHKEVTCGSIEEKMGIHGSPTCVMNYDGAIGYLIGERCKGLNAMFVMMNEARLGVAIQGLSQSEVAYQNAVTYAKERLQGRALTGAINKTGPADPIIVHPDVRRMLLDIKSFNEAARYWVLAAALMCDIADLSEDPEEKQAAEDRLSILTPILKGVFTDVGFENTVTAQQVYGGHGYIKEWGMEQFVRDSRIAQIYEGTNGIQALDLVGRKLPRNNGRATVNFFKTAETELETFKSNPDLSTFVDTLDIALMDLKNATMWLMQNGASNPANAGSAAYDYMNLFGLYLLGSAWMHIVVTAIEKKATDPDSTAWMDSKILTARYFFERTLPTTSLLLRKITAGSATMMSMPEDQF